MRAAWRSLAVLLLLAAGVMPVLAQGRGGKGVSQGQGASQGQGTASADDPIIASLPYWDFNHDGVYTCANWKRYMTELFNRADRRKRGYIDAQEFESIKAADQMFVNADFDYFDEQKKGRISKSDFVERPSPFFIRYDSRHTCRVARTDINAAPSASAAPQGRGRSGGRRSGF